LPKTAPKAHPYPNPQMPKTYYTYIVASRAHILYIGVTSNIEQRIWQHKNKAHEGFTARYNCNRLVWFETFSNAISAITREKELKGWLRLRKVELIEETNPTWSDLSESWGQPIVFTTSEHP
jgi:putative endonuclease